MKKKLIFIVDDEPDIRNLLCIGLENEGYLTKGFETGISFINYTDTSNSTIASDKDCSIEESLQSNIENTDIPHLIILDIMLPHTNGLDICRTMKQHAKYSQVPIILLSAKETEIDKVLGLELGADDYITKPFSIKELCARIKAVLRRQVEHKDISTYPHTQSQTQNHIPPSSLQKNSPTLRYKDKLQLNLNTYEVHLEDERIELTKTEFSILAHMLQSPKWVFSRENLLTHLWGSSKFVSDRTIDVHIKHIRDKLGSSCDIIKNIRGVGYKIE